MKLNVIITGATGMVGEGVLLACLAHPDIQQVLVVGRKPFGRKHYKLRELLVPDFRQLDAAAEQLTGYDACFYCAGVSAVGMSEEAYRAITYDTTLHFAATLARLNPNMVFEYVSGQGTDSSEQGGSMWARVKGQTENALQRLPFKAVYCVRPAIMKPSPGQQNVKPVLKVISSLYPVMRLLMPKFASTLQEVGLAMIHSAQKGYHKPVLEVPDIKALAQA